jgi:hypothetical protein
MLYIAYISKSLDFSSFIIKSIIITFYSLVTSLIGYSSLYSKYLLYLFY